MSYNTFYPRRAAYFDRVIQKFHPGASILLDLACGTGSLSIELARLGYDVVGTDASQQMLSEAMLKKEIALYGENFEREEPSDPGIAKLLFLCQPMQELDMYGTLDAAVCALDSLNHVTDPQVVQRMGCRYRWTWISLPITRTTTPIPAPARAFASAPIPTGRSGSLSKRAA